MICINVKDTRSSSITNIITIFFRAINIWSCLSHILLQWEDLENTTKNKGEKLFDANRHILYEQNCDDIDGWINEIESQIVTEDVGHDLTTVNLLVQKQNVSIPSVKEFAMLFSIMLAVEKFKWLSLVIRLTVPGMWGNSWGSRSFFYTKRCLISLQISQNKFQNGLSRELCISITRYFE